MMLNKEEKQTVIKEFGKDAQDTGSTEVQIALLTRNIVNLTSHCQLHPKDSSSRRGMLKMVHQRKSLLGYLENKDSKKYENIIKKLGLRK